MAASGSFTLGELAATLEARLEGDPARRVSGVAPLESAGPDQISFLTDPATRGWPRPAGPAPFLRPRGRWPGLPGAVLRVAAPQAGSSTSSPLPPGPPPRPATTGSPGWPRARASIAARGGGAASPSWRAAARSAAAAACTPSCSWARGAEIGEDVVLYPHVSLRDGVRVGRRVIVHAGAVLGADGFGFAFDGSAHRKIPQVGGVLIEDDVEIGANTTIDRATFGDTIGRGTKIDNLVQVGHNCRDRRALAAGRPGRASPAPRRSGGAWCWPARSAWPTTSRSATASSLAAQSGVPSDIAAGEVWSGTPARPMTEAKRILVAEERLPELLRRVRALEQRLTELEKGAKSAAMPDERTAIHPTALVDPRARARRGRARRRLHGRRPGRRRWATASSSAITSCSRAGWRSARACGIGHGAIMGGGAPGPEVQGRASPPASASARGTVLREYVTIHRATTPRAGHEIGRDCLLMGPATSPTTAGSATTSS